jgi:hypothetical protein
MCSADSVIVLATLKFSVPAVDAIDILTHRPWSRYALSAAACASRYSGKSAPTR